MSSTRADAVFGFIDGWIPAAIMFVIIGTISAECVARIAFDSTFEWNVELLALAAPIAIFLAGAGCLRIDRIIALDALDEIIRGPADRVRRIMAGLVTLAVSGIWAWLALQLALDTQLPASAVLHIPDSAKSYGVAIAFTLMVCYAVRLIVELLTDSSQDGEYDERIQLIEE